MQSVSPLLVCTGHKDSAQRDLEFRLSWSVYEILLTKDMPLWVKQAYVAFKYTVKQEMAKVRGDSDRADGRSIISSYHLKNILFWTLEEPTAWQICSPFKLYLKLVENFSGYLNSPEAESSVCRLPLYFLPDCNLLERVPSSEIEFAREAIRNIREDPIMSIMTSPIEPTTAYGWEFQVAERMNMRRQDREEIYGDISGYIGAGMEALLSITVALQTAENKSLDSKEYKHMKALLELVDEHRNDAYRRCRESEAKFSEPDSQIDRSEFISLQRFLTKAITEYNNIASG